MSDVVSIGRCQVCDRMSKLRNGACERCVGLCGGSVALILSKMRSDPILAEVLKEQFTERLVSKFGEAVASRMVGQLQEGGHPVFIEMFGLAKGPR